jgi:hypothetical protein
MRDYTIIYSQRDPAWQSSQLGSTQGATIGAYGCLLTCQAMKAGYYGHEIKPNALNDIYNQRDLYINGDLLNDNAISNVFNDIVLTDSQSYVGIPANLSYLKQLAADPTLTVTIEVDFDHNPNDGVQTHFVELHDFDGVTLTIFDPWYGSADNFATHYGTDPATTIQKITVYKGTPAKPGTFVDADTFNKLVSNSTANDAVCDELSLHHDVGKDAEIATVRQLKTNKAQAEQTILNLNKQIPDLEGQISTLNNQVLDTTQKLNLAVEQANTNANAQKLLEQSTQDLKIAKQSLMDLQETYNRTIAQYQNTSALLMPKKQLFNILLTRLIGLSTK